MLYHVLLQLATDTTSKMFSKLYLLLRLLSETTKIINVLLLQLLNGTKKKII